MTTSTNPSPMCALTPKQAAHYLSQKFGLSVCDKVLREMAKRGEGPPRYKPKGDPNAFVRGERVFYRADDLDRYGFSIFRIDISCSRQMEAA